MPRPKTNKAEPEADWKADFSKVMEITKDQRVFLGGVEVDAITLENLKTEASMIRTGILFQVLGSTLESFATNYALKKISIKESADVRSTQLAYAQAFTDLNVQLWTNIALLAKL